MEWIRRILPAFEDEFGSDDLINQPDNLLPEAFNSQAGQVSAEMTPQVEDFEESQMGSNQDDIPSSRTIVMSRHSDIAISDSPRAQNKVREYKGGPSDSVGNDGASTSGADQDDLGTSGKAAPPMATLFANFIRGGKSAPQQCQPNAPLASAAAEATESEPTDSALIQPIERALGPQANIPKSEKWVHFFGNLRAGVWLPSVPTKPSNNEETVSEAEAEERGRRTLEEHGIEGLDENDADTDPRKKRTYKRLVILIGVSGLSVLVLFLLWLLLTGRSKDDEKEPADKGVEKAAPSTTASTTTATEASNSAVEGPSPQLFATSSPTPTPTPVAASSSTEEADSASDGARSRGLFTWRWPVRSKGSEGLSSTAGAVEFARASGQGDTWEVDPVGESNSATPGDEKNKAMMYSFALAAALGLLRLSTMRR